MNLRDTSAKWKKAYQAKRKGNYEQAKIHFLHLVNLGEVQAYVEIAQLYRLPSKDNWKQDYSQALEWYQRSIQHIGDDFAYLGAAELYFLGLGTTKDYAKAKEYFSAITDPNILQKQLYLANCYQFGLGCQVSERRAMVHYRKAAQEGNLSAKKALANYLNDQGKTFASAMMNANYFYSKATSVFKAKNSNTKVTVLDG
ncbi:tetratricopeptide repeat protein [Kangiella sp. HZ709]|uniref:tetratricopeptide repeat protein n=1 Tax=Kangiella sp. HZ709 TaxID=2666328 RepID=UPI0012AF5FD6|nr:SEL1-like repeat protein [Kangiella sp. HZ709]MRX26810.1 hypothetical protein [Kangiella sp. HZ709]